jgi:hypothetical protein
VIVTPLVGRRTENVPHGLIHDWRGVIFIPGTNLDDVWAVVHAYNNYRTMYRPVVTFSKELASDENTQEFEMVWQYKVLFVSAAMEGRYHARDVMLDPYRRYSVADAV